MRRYVVLLVALVSGCLSADLAAPGSWAGGSMTRGAAAHKGSTNYSIVFLVRDERIYFVMLIEGASSGRVASGSAANGEFRKSDGSTTWEVSSRNGRTGRVTIAGQSFQLEDGAVFLVNTREKDVGLRQLRINLDAFNAGDWSVDDRLRRLGESNATVREFLAYCETPK